MAVQSFTMTEAAENSFSFPPQPRLTQMNVRPDMLRQPGMPQLPGNMLSLTTPQFIPPQQQPHPQPNMALIPGANNPSLHPPTQQANISPAQTAQRQQYQYLHNTFRRGMMQNQNPQSLTSSGPAPNAHLSGLAHTQLGMGFPGGMMQQQASNVATRRMTSQSQQPNQGPGHLGGMPPGVNGLGLGMPNQGIPTQLRQTSQQHQPAQQQQQSQSTQQQQPNLHPQINMRMTPQQLQNLSPDMAMALRQSNTAAALSQGIARSTSAMNGLTQTPALTPAHSSGMQSALQHNSFQNAIPISLQHQQPQIASSPRSGTLSQSLTQPSLTNAGPPQTIANRRQMTPDGSGMFMNFQNSPFPQTPNTANRLPPNAGPFPFVPSSSSPPSQHLTLQQSLPSGMGGPHASGARGFQLTPAQQFEQMQTGDNYASHFNIPPSSQSVAPPRPSSHNDQHQPGTLPTQQPTHPRPQSQQQDQMAHLPPHQQRPQSQPTTQSGIPLPPQTDQSQTPRGSQPSLPPNTMPAVRASSLSQQPLGGPSQPPHPSSQLPVAGQGHPSPANARGSLSTSGSSSSIVSSSAPQPSEFSSLHSPLSARHRELLPTNALGFGQGLIRLLQFSGHLASENQQKWQLAYWDSLIQEFFTPKAIMKFTLWKDNQRAEAKQFDIGVPILPRFFLVTTQSGVKAMTLSLDGARERLYSPGHAVIESSSAVWTYKYINGYTVTLRGPITAHVIIAPVPNSQPQQLSFSYKFDNLQFDALWHDKFIALDAVVGHRILSSPSMQMSVPAPTSTGGRGLADQRREEERGWDESRLTILSASIPGEPVNAFGIPQATMRCLELAESVSQMSDLMNYANENRVGPLEALAKFAAKIRDTPMMMPNSIVRGPPGMGSPMGAMVGHNFQSFQPIGGIPGTTPILSSAVTLYSTAPSSTISSSSSQTAQSASPQNAPQSADNSPLKQHSTIPQQSQPPPHHSQQQQQPQQLQMQSQQQQQQSQPSQPTSNAVSVPTPTPSGTGAASSAPGPSGPNTTPSMSNASLKRKQPSETSSPTTANAEQAPKRMTRNKRRTTNG